MKKGKAPRADSIRREYKRSDFPNGFVRRKYVVRVAAQTNIVRLDPKIADAFPNSKAVNEALATILRAAEAARQAKRR
jgi:hypothetical protein